MFSLFVLHVNPMLNIYLSLSKVSWLASMRYVWEYDAYPYPSTSSAIFGKGETELNKKKLMKGVMLTTGSYTCHPRPIPPQHLPARSHFCPWTFTHAQTDFHLRYLLVSAEQEVTKRECGLVYPTCVTDVDHPPALLSTGTTLMIAESSTVSAVTDGFCCLTD